MSDTAWLAATSPPIGSARTEYLTITDRGPRLCRYDSATDTWRTVPGCWNAHPIVWAYVPTGPDMQSEMGDRP